MPVKVGIISIGDELLNGLTVDSNSSWIARNISKYESLVISSKITVGDESENIKKRLNYLLNRNHEYIFITGGLGPTHDDITKRVLCEYFNCKLKLDINYHNKLKEAFIKRKIENSKHIVEQAQIIDISKPIKNNYGTALGMMISIDNSNIFVMPGVPREMEGMMNDYIIPTYISNKYKKTVNCTTILTTGIYESKLSNILKDIIEENKNFKVAFLPDYTGVKLRLSIGGKNIREKDLFDFKDKIVSKINKYVYGYNNDKLENIVAEILSKKKLSISIAESCTGGYLSKVLTDIPGSSKYFNGSVVAYSNDVKENILNIDKVLLKKYGAVSKQVALEMAQSIKTIFKTDIGVSTTGISGPGGGSADKPVGTIYICIIYKEKKIIKKFHLIQDRDIHRKVAVQVALNIIRLSII